jgi:hypothetical protein
LILWAARDIIWTTKQLIVFHMVRLPEEKADQLK